MDKPSAHVLYLPRLTNLNQYTMERIIETENFFERKPLVNNVMDCIFSPGEIDRMQQPSHVVTMDAAASIYAQEVTVITGTDAARTALFVKMLAATVITRDYPFATELTSPLVGGKVLWIDSANSLQATTQLASDMKQIAGANSSNFKIAALTALGRGVDHIYTVEDVVKEAISDSKPHLIIINNLDTLLPYASWNFIYHFTEHLRGYIVNNHAALCAIGHNLIGKIKRTTGYLGEILYPVASTVYRVSERSKNESAITRVSCYKTFHRCPKDFAFTINELNFPQQVDIQQQKPETGKQTDEKLQLPEN